MTHETERRIIEGLDAILECERTALLIGDFATIQSLTTEKERLIDALNALTEQPANALSALQAKLARNQALMDGTLQGIRSVAARLAAHRRVRKSLETYDEYGRRRSFSGDLEHNVEKRA